MHTSKLFLYLNFVKMHISIYNICTILLMYTLIQSPIENFALDMNGLVCSSRFKTKLACAIDYFNSPIRDEYEHDDPVNCLSYVEAYLQKLPTMFKEIRPDNPAYATSGFRQRGDPCDPKKENDFIGELLAVFTSKLHFCQRLDPPLTEEACGKSSLNPGNDWVMQEMSRIWELHFDQFYKDICNPRWLLECDPASKLCVCMKHSFQPMLDGIPEIEWKPKFQFVPVIECVKSPESACGLNNTVTKTNGLQYGGKCVAAASEWVKIPQSERRDPKQSEETRPGFGKAHKIEISQCGLSLPIVGICSSNCLRLSDCTEPKPEDNPTKHPDIRICCVNKDCSNPHAKKNHGWRISRSSESLMWFLPGIVSVWMLLWG